MANLILIQRWRITKIIVSLFMDIYKFVTASWNLQNECKWERNVHVHVLYSNILKALQISKFRTTNFCHPSSWCPLYTSPSYTLWLICINEAINIYQMKIC